MIPLQHPCELLPWKEMRISKYQRKTLGRSTIRKFVTFIHLFKIYLRGPRILVSLKGQRQIRPRGSLPAKSSLIMGGGVLSQTTHALWLLLWDRKYGGSGEVPKEDEIQGSRICCGEEGQRRGRSVQKCQSNKGLGAGALLTKNGSLEIWS